MNLSITLREDVIHADACMLMRFVKGRIEIGDKRPISARQACEAVHRRQGPELNKLDAAHLFRVAARIDSSARPIGFSFGLHRPLDIDAAACGAILDALDINPASLDEASTYHRQDVPDASTIRTAS